MVIRNLIVCLHESFENHAWRSEHKLASQNVPDYCRYCFAFRETIWVFFLNGLRKYQREKRFDKIFEAKCGMEECNHKYSAVFKNCRVEVQDTFEREGRRRLSIKTHPRLTSSSFCHLSLVSFFPTNFLECSQSPSFFRKIVRIERLPVQAAILVSYVPRGRVPRFIVMGGKGEWEGRKKIQIRPPPLIK